MARSSNSRSPKTVFKSDLSDVDPEIDSPPLSSASDEMRFSNEHRSLEDLRSFAAAPDISKVRSGSSHFSLSVDLVKPFPFPIRPTSGTEFGGWIAELKKQISTTDPNLLATLRERANIALGSNIPAAPHLDAEHAEIGIFFHPASRAPLAPPLEEVAYQQKLRGLEVKLRPYLLGATPMQVNDFRWVLGAKQSFLREFRSNQHLLCAMYPDYFPPFSEFPLAGEFHEQYSHLLSSEFFRNRDFVDGVPSRSLQLPMLRAVDMVLESIGISLDEENHHEPICNNREEDVANSVVALGDPCDTSIVRNKLPRETSFTSAQAAAEHMISLLETHGFNRAEVERAMGAALFGNKVRSRRRAQNVDLGDYTAFDHPKHGFKARRDQYRKDYRTAHGVRPYSLSETDYRIEDWLNEEMPDLVEQQALTYSMIRRYHPSFGAALQTRRKRHNRDNPNDIISLDELLSMKKTSIRQSLMDEREAEASK